MTSIKSSTILPERGEFAIISPKEVQQQLQAEIERRKNAGNPPPPNPPRIASAGEFWTIDNVIYRRETWKVDLAKTLLDNGATKTQDNWIAYTRDARTQGAFYLPDFPLFHATINALYKQRENPNIEEIRAWLQQQSRAKYFMTTTRILYKASGNDEVIHDHTLPAAQRIEVSFVGSDGWIKDSASPQAVQTLLGTTQNMQEINKVYRWLNQTDAYLWRLNNRSQHDTERVARFVADSDRVDFNCNRDLQDSDSGFGVRARK